MTSTMPLREIDQEFLDAQMLAYLNRRSCTEYHTIMCHFELHDAEELQASLDRLLALSRVRYDERRDGYCTCAPSQMKGEDT